MPKNIESGSKPEEAYENIKKGETWNHLREGYGPQVDATIEMAPEEKNQLNILRIFDAGDSSQGRVDALVSRLLAGDRPICSISAFSSPDKDEEKFEGAFFFDDMDLKGVAKIIEEHGGGKQWHKLEEKMRRRSEYAAARKNK